MFSLEKSLRSYQQSAWAQKSDFCFGFWLFFCVLLVLCWFVVCFFWGLDGSAQDGGQLRLERTACRVVHARGEDRRNRDALAVIVRVPFGAWLDAGAVQRQPAISTGRRCPNHDVAAFARSSTFSTGRKRDGCDASTRADLELVLLDTTQRTIAHDEKHDFGLLQSD